DDDFFRVLGGDSLLAAQLISKLRDDPATATLTVRDLYESRTVAELAKRTPAVEHQNGVLPAPARQRPAGKPVLATIVQAAWLLLGLLISAPLAYAVIFHALPAIAEALGLALFILLAPAFYFGSMTGYTVVSVAVAVAVKKLLIGRYQPLRAPVWGSFY